MPLRNVTGEELISALNHALARTGEMTGPDDIWDTAVNLDDLNAKFAQFGLDAEGVKTALNDRWPIWREASRDVTQMVVKAYVEGLLCGRQLEREGHAV